MWAGLIILGQPCGFQAGGGAAPSDGFGAGGAARGGTLRNPMDAGGDGGTEEFEYSQAVEDDV